MYVQAGTPFRMLPDNINQWYVRNASGTMAPLSAYSSTEWTYGSPRLERYNGIPSMEILGEAAAGKSTGDAMKFMADLVAKLPAGVGYSWTGLSYQEALSSNQAPALYAISLVVVFLALAALYESWSIPFSVMLVVPLGVVGALLATDLRGLSNDVYFQVGLLTTIGLSAKNAILIVEFAVEMMQKKENADRGNHRSGADAFTPNPDDLSGLYSRRAAAGYQSWCRFWRAKRGRYRRDGRDVCRNSAGNLLRSGLFRCSGTSLCPL